MHRILITVLTRVPGRPGLCAWCAPFLDELGLTGKAEAEAGPELPAEDAAAWHALLVWAEHLAHIHLGRLRFRFLDPATPLGLWYVLRHRIKEFPTFILPDGSRVAGWNPQGVEARIGDLVARPA